MTSGTVSPVLAPGATGFPAHPAPLPDVSIVMATCAREMTLAAAIRSALAQQGVTIEVVVVDDSAWGEAAAIVAAIADPRVRYVRSATPGGGPCRARNDGWPEARGACVFFMDDDDLLADGGLAALVQLLREHPDAGVAVGTIQPFGDDEALVSQSHAHFQRSRQAMAAMRSRWQLVSTLLFADAPLNSGCCIVRRACLPALGGYAIEVARCEGVDLYARAIRRFGFVFTDRPLLHYRIDARSLMHASSGELVGAAYRSIQRRYRREFGTLEYLALRVRAAAAAWHRPRPSERPR